MSSVKHSLRVRYKEFVPKLFICLQEGYSLTKFQNDLLAGLTIGIITLPLAMAFAISSGLSPDKGLFTSVVAGFIISALGGSRFQIGGPTGAFVVIVYEIVQKHGYEGLALATLLAGFLLVIMGLLRLGAFLKFIPHPVTVGLTLGIALVLFVSQIKDFLGLEIQNAPADFLDKLEVYYHHIGSLNFVTFLVAIASLIIVIFFRKKIPKVPGAIVAVILSSLIVYIWDLPVATIESKFGQIPSMLPSPSIPWVSMEKLRDIAPEAITIALLSGLESLLSAVVADGMTGYRHKSNCELVAQGLANIGSIIFGGIPATGAIARTATNIRLGAKTPISGMLHSVFVFIILFFFANLASKIPLACLAAILMVIAWYMADISQVVEIFKGPKSDIALLLVTFGIAVIIDITVAVEVGVILAAIFFMKRMADSTSLSRKSLVEGASDIIEKKDPDALYRKEIPKGVEVFQINGPLFFGAADLLCNGISFSKEKYKVVILRMSHVQVIDMTGVKALKFFYDRCSEEGLTLLVSGINSKVFETLNNTGLSKEIGVDHIFAHIDDALSYAKIELVKG